jgi:hypothetical protein
MKHSVLRGSDLHSPSNELVENNTGSTIPKFTAVTFSSIGIAYPEIVLANGATDIVRGVTQTEITNGGVGYITALGFLNNVNTSIWTVGTKLYAQASGVISSTVTGLPVGVVIKQNATTGIVYVENTGITRNDLSDLVVPDATTTIKGKIKLSGDLAGTADLPTVPGLLTKEPVIIAATSADYYRGDKTFQPLNKSTIGLSNVDNTSDVNKPVSTAQAAADAAVQAYAIQRSNHTGTQLSSTISDFTEAVQDSVSSALTNTSTINLSYNDLSNQITADVNNSSITDSLLATGINANKIGAGTVSNTEFGYLDGTTSSIQTQINGKYNNPTGLASQYIKGDGTFATFPDIPGGGGGGAVYYFNGGTSQGTISGTPYYQLSIAANTGASADFTRTGNGLLASFLTDIGSPNLPLIPAGIWIFETYLSESSSGGTLPEVYAEVQKYDGTTFTTISTSTVEQLTNGTAKDLYTYSLTIPSSTAIATTDRIAIKFYTSNATGRTVTLYTQNGNTSAVQTTFTTGIASINGLTTSSQYFGVGTSGSDFGISSTGDTHTFNLPSSSATKRGLLTSGDWTIFNNKEPAIALGTTSQYYRGDKTFQTLDKTAVGLPNVDNTSDANKPISTATQTALNNKEDLVNKATDLSVLNNTKYPTTQATQTAIDTALATAYYFAIAL